MRPVRVTGECGLSHSISDNVAGISNEAGRQTSPVLSIAQAARAIPFASANITILAGFAVSIRRSQLLVKRWSGNLGQFGAQQSSGMDFMSARGAQVLIGGIISLGWRQQTVFRLSIQRAG